MPRVEFEGGSLDLPELLPQGALLAQRQAIDDLRPFMGAPRSGRQIRDWVGADHLRKTQVALVAELLGGRPLEEADDAWREAYLAWRETDHHARAAWFVARVLIGQGASPFGLAALEPMGALRGCGGVVGGVEGR